MSLSSPHIAEMFSNDGVSWSDVKSYSNSYSWKLAAGSGQRSVYARFRDRDGNWGEVVSDNVILN